MAIVVKKVNGYGPYTYRVTYQNGDHNWEYLGRTDVVGRPDQAKEQNASEQLQDVESVDELPTLADIDLAEYQGWMKSGSYSIMKVDDGTPQLSVSVEQAGDGWEVTGQDGTKIAREERNTILQKSRAIEIAQEYNDSKYQGMKPDDFTESEKRGVWGLVDSPGQGEEAKRHDHIESYQKKESNRGYEVYEVNGGSENESNYRIYNRAADGRVLNSSNDYESKEEALEDIERRAVKRIPIHRNKVELDDDD